MCVCVCVLLAYYVGFETSVFENVNFMVLTWVYTVMLFSDSVYIQHDAVNNYMYLYITRGPYVYTALCAIKMMENEN